MRISDWSSDVCSSDLKAGMRLRAKMRGADQITVLDRGRDRERIHCIGSFCSCRKRELARTDNTIIVSPMAAAKMITNMRRSFHLDPSHDATGSPADVWYRDQPELT